MNKYKVIRKPPTVEDYLNIRNNTTLGPRDEAGARKGVQNCWFGVHIKDSEKTVAMGRIIGDGGCTFQITDIAVLPQCQGKGLGKKIMEVLMEYYRENAPKDAYLSLIADGEAKFLYQKFGFKATAPESIGMRYIK
ncbi:acetyltransferase (GNAT) family protein [Halanaerobium saccharolyticum]|uniref:Acetyltransferase (GNAT) family protein n=1 Tax=Halanaerobium saccharolyticum TaxID=43595 RepID=A0A4R7YTV0_9FIRM|nr:GNAT family N-acetyltransferase [Halanaerobium saccharolyticum]RAK10254.1 acetyltransferase (GNAT) family protein [Halanaerobium saccharolyticum]TDW00466.1 acetyltransferase (GNAT) family protein [Halanaerobium saccharolyticum]TDX52051.1 acetyltransferase (GNAT) family protein [Halanaerobium saccharolyticum]